MAPRTGSAHPTHRSRRARHLRHGAAALTIALLVAACRGEEVDPFGTAEVTVEPVVQVIATPATVVSRTFAATVRDAARVDVLSPGVGSIATLEVLDGATVSAGQQLGRVRSDALTSALRTAEAAYTSALTAQRAASDALDRGNDAPAERPTTFANRAEEAQVLLAEALAEVARLRADGASDAELRAELLIAQQLRTEYDAWVRLNDTLTASRASLASAQQTLDQARRSVADLTLVAPVAGTVRIGRDLVAGGGRTLGIGSDVTAGQSLLTVTATGGHRIDLTVPEADLAPVTAGARVTVDLNAYPGTTVSGRVARVISTSIPATAASAATTVFTAEVELDDVAGLALRDGLTGTALLPELAFADRFEVRLEVDEIDVVLVEVGQRVSVELDALRGQPLAGTVVALATTPERSATGATIYRARVRLDAPAAADLPPLRGGLTGTGDVEVQRLDAPLTVPSTALRRSGGNEVVYVVRGGVAVEVPVRVLAFGEARAAIDGDVRVGELVVTIGVERIANGDPVELG